MWENYGTTRQRGGWEFGMITLVRNEPQTHLKCGVLQGNFEDADRLNRLVLDTLVAATGEESTFFANALNTRATLMCKMVRFEGTLLTT